MKQLLSLLFLLVALFAQTAWAQELTIESFSQSNNDITASTESRLDGNGEPCALVKVGLPLENAAFEGEIVGEVKNHSGEYWVYMVAGSKYLNVKHSSVLPLKISFADYGFISLTAKSTYELRLQTPQLAPGQQDDGCSYIAFSITPANAQLVVDGEGKTLSTMGQWTKRLPRGSHSYTITCEGYTPKTGTFDLGFEKITISENLESNASTVSITCETPDADIYVNDQRYATNSSWKGTLVPGQYLIEARKEGYYKQSKSVAVGQKQQLTFRLDALVARVGSLDVSYTPIDAEVWFDGRKLGTTPDLFRNIPIGSHQVELRKDGYQPVSQRVTIEEGKTASLSGSLVQTAAAAQSAAVQTSPLMSGQSSAASPVAANGSAKTFTVNGVSFTMIAVQGGTFEMGAGQNVHSVTLSDYSIGETEVTQELWKAVMGKGITQIAQENGGKTYGEGANYPMYYVSWDDCQEFIKKLNSLTGVTFRLPTEAEWEYAARGGTQSRKMEYAGSSNIADVAWYDKNSGGKTHAVKKKMPNELGLYDMSGNVWEWCQDTYGSFGARVFRGGGWNDYAHRSSIAFNNNHDGPAYCNYDLGMRLAF